MYKIEPSTTYSYKGIIIVDILVAFSLSTVFVLILSSAYSNVGDLYILAHNKSHLLDVYEDHEESFQGMLPYESRSLVVPPYDISESTTTIQAVSRKYGNERVETDISISGSEGLHTSSSSRPLSINFVSVSRNTNIADDDMLSHALCSVDYQRINPFGSYSAYGLGGLNPQVVPISLPVDPTLPLTDIEVRNGFAYISVDSNRSSDPDLFVIDIHDVDHPIVSSLINTGPGISSFSLVGNNIFAAAASTASQLHVIHITNPDSISLTKKYQIPLPYATATPPIATSIDYDDYKIYIGTEKWEGDELTVIDVTNPMLPNKISGLEIGNQVNDIYVKNGFAYVVGAGLHQFGSIDVTNDSLLLPVDWFNPSGWERQEGIRIDIFEDQLRFGRTSGGFNITGDHELFSWASTSNMAFYDSTSTDIRGGVYGIIGDRYRTYLATRDTGREIQIVDKNFSTIRSISLPVAPQTMTCDNDKLYILARNAPMVYEVKISK